MSSPYTHLHCHSCYSLLDGLSRIDDLLQSAVAMDMPALALTDHGTMFGAIEFYGKARELGVKPIIGCEVYVSDRPLGKRPGPGSKNYHLVLLAENETGYRNLIQLTTEAHMRGFYRKPRVDHALLEQHAEGLICLSACASGEVASLILDENLSGAEERADWYRQTFPGRYYLEMQYHEMEMQTRINQGVLHLSQRLGLPLVATNDVHYVQARQARAQEILLCIQTQTTMDDPKRMRMETQEFYLKSPEQMHALFGDVPGAISNTLAIAERCNLELSFGRPHLPKFDAPDGLSSEQYLRRLCEEGLRVRYQDPSGEARERLEYEIDVINSTGFVDYFLLVYDVIAFARRSGISVGPGRGSAAASMVAYCLFITNLDPVKHGLSFERFLNPERVSMPDMDLDFADDRRDEVIRYVTERYGRERVAQIITFGTIGPKAGIRDVGRVLGMSYADIDRVAKLVPPMVNKLARAKEEAQELQELYDSDPAIHSLLDTVSDLEGVARHASTHAAGVVISKDPLSQHVPLYKVPKSEQVTTQYAMASVEKIGLLKMDFLGLRTLTVLERARQFIEQSTGQSLVIDDLPLEDPSIYQLLSAGDTFGIFQVDGSGFRKLLRELKPTEFKHIVAAGALYRPGPMEHIPEFVARKNGLKRVRYDHPALEEVLEETYGVVVYQDQVMRLAVRVAGYSMGEADLLRRAMGKKKASELAKHRDTFIERAGALGTDARTAEHLFNVIEPFAGYAFNKAHAAAYAMITCQTAYLKANYPREYMAGLLSAERESAEKVAEAIAECRRLGISVLGPDVNSSDLDFKLEDDGIRFGLSAVKHVGRGAIESILAEREKTGPFRSLDDFCARLDWTCVNKRVVESFARCGALESLGTERGRLVANLDYIVQFGTQLQRAGAAGQVSLFGGEDSPRAELQLALAAAASLDDKVSWEQELLGFVISRHPVADIGPRMQEMNGTTVSELVADGTPGPVRVGGLLRSVHSFPTRYGKPMAKFQLTDLRGTIEGVAFARSYELVKDQLIEGAIVVCDGTLDTADGRPQLMLDAVHTMEAARQKPFAGSRAARPARGNGHLPSGPDGANASAPAQPSPSSGPPARVSVYLARSGDKQADLRRVERVYTVLQRFPGRDEVELLIRQGRATASLSLPNRSVGYCAALRRELESVVGDGEVRVVDATGTPLPDEADVTPERADRAG